MLNQKSVVCVLWVGKELGKVVQLSQGSVQVLDFNGVRDQQPGWEWSIVFEERTKLRCALSLPADQSSLGNILIIEYRKGWMVGDIFLQLWSR